MNDKRDRVYHILAGTVEVPEEYSSPSILVEIQRQELPALKPNMISFVAVPLAFMLVAVLLFVYEAVKGPLLAPGVSSMLVLLLVIVWLGACLRWHKRQIAEVADHYATGLQELRSLHEYLDSYLTNLDERTSRYFHCVTNTKVLNYCVLRQINAALGEKVEEITRLLSTLDPASLIKARNLLVGMLFFYDGALANTGNAHLMPMARLQVAVRMLVETLDAGVTELEEEIAAARSLYDAPVEGEGEE